MPPKMWSIEVHVATIEDWSSYATYLLMAPSTRVGRPAKNVADAQNVDLCFQGDSSLSKIHCILEQQDGRLSVKDTSRFGILINGQKMVSESVRDLESGDILKLASKVHARVVRRPALIVCVPHGTLDPSVMDAVSSLGGLELTASLDANCNYFIHLDGGDASSALARAVITGVEITTPSWLSVLLGRKVWESALPSCKEYAPRSITLGQRNIELRDKISIRQDIWTGIKFLFFEGFHDEDLAFCIHSTGGLVLPSIPPSGEIYPIVAVSNKLSTTQYTPMGYNPIAHVTPTELLSVIFSGDPRSRDTVHQRILNSKLVLENEVPHLYASKNNLQTLGDKTVDFEHPHHQSTADEDFGSTGGQPSNSHPLNVHGATSQTKNYKSFCKSITIDAHMHPPLSMFIVNGISADVGPVIMDDTSLRRLRPLDDEDFKVDRTVRERKRGRLN